MAPTEPRMLGVAEVASALGLTDQTVRAMTRRGEIPFSRFGLKILIPRAWVDAVASADREPAVLAL